MTNRDCLAQDGSLTLAALTATDIPAVQALYEANPEYSIAVNGYAPRPGDAADDFHSRPPDDWVQGPKHFFGAFDNGELIGVADVVEGLLHPTVGHIGYFMIARTRHGDGSAVRFYTLLEAWFRAQGMRWLRLGVVAGNSRAERFWERRGFIEVRRRADYPQGERRHVLRVLVKPLADGALADYLALVSRDRPE